MQLHARSLTPTLMQSPFREGGGLRGDSAPPPFECGGSENSIETKVDKMLIQPPGFENLPTAL